MTRSEGFRMTLILGISEGKALQAYATREGIPIKVAAHRLLIAEIERAAAMRACPSCGGSGKVPP